MDTDGPMLVDSGRIREAGERFQVPSRGAQGSVGLDCPVSASDS
jgi:hypothetical protein